MHPDDLPRVTEALLVAIDTGGDYAAEYRVCLPDGDPRWVFARGRALRDGSGATTRVLGAAYDTTREHHGEVRVTRVLEATRAGSSPWTGSGASPTSTPKRSGSWGDRVSSCWAR